MFSQLINIDIVSKEGDVYSKKVSLINLRSREGEMSLSYGHTQLLSVLPAGIIQVKPQPQVEEQDLFLISPGIVEVQPSQVIILSDIMYLIKNANQKSIMKIRQRAYEMLQGSRIMNESDMEKISIELSSNG